LRAERRFVPATKRSSVAGGTKMAFLCCDHRAGCEALPVLEAAVRKEGCALRRFAVQPPGLAIANHGLPRTGE
jgi:hypothetical protein